MAKKIYPQDISDQAKSVLDKWKQIDPSLALGDLTQAALETNINEAQSMLSRMTTLQAELTDLQNKREALCAVIWDQVKRVRGGVKAVYGDDSSQYEMIGGTRKSDYKRPVRKAAAPAKTE